MSNQASPVRAERDFFLKRREPPENEKDLLKIKNVIASIKSYNAEILEGKFQEHSQNIDQMKKKNSEELIKKQKN